MLPWFKLWLHEHLERHMTSGLPAANVGTRFYDAWESEFEHNAISESAAELASIRLVSKAPKPSYHFSMLLKVARDIEKAWVAKRAELAANAPKPIEDEPVPRGQDLRECIALARGNGPLARLYRVMFRRLITAGKIDPDRIPEAAWEERASDKADDHKAIIPRLTRVR